MILILFAGYLKNAEVSVDALSIWYVTPPPPSYLTSSHTLLFQRF